MSLNYSYIVEYFIVTTISSHSRRQVSKAVGVLRGNLLVVGAPIGRMYRNLLDKS